MSGELKPLNPKPTAKTGGVFKIVELGQIHNSDGTYTDSQVNFSWDAAHQSSPRNDWQFGLKQRTKRRDYPGSDIPTEQLLGPNYKPFTVTGVWDDRYNYAGFAEDMRTQMEGLVQRGNLVRVSFEALQIHGIITDLDITYKRSYYQGYSFSFSPHYRKSGGDVRKQKTNVPQTLTDPTTLSQQLISQCQALQNVHLLCPKPYIAGGLFDTVNDAVNAISNAAFKVNQILSGRVLTILSSDITSSSIQRLSQSFSDSLIAATSIPLALAGSSSATGLGYNQSAVTVLEFESWTREMSATARLIMYLCAKAAYQLALAAKSKALAIYKPYTNESLYSISNRFYGTPFKWRDIADRNNLDYFTLTGAETLVIPDNRTSSTQ